MIAEKSWVDSPIMRLLAFVIAIALGYWCWQQWQPQLRQTWAMLTTGEDNAAIDNECLRVKMLAIDRSLQNGVIDEAQHQTAKDRASQLCLAQQQ